MRAHRPSHHGRSGSRPSLGRTRPRLGALLTLGLAVLTVWVVLGAIGAAAQQAGSWPELQGGPAHLGSVPAGGAPAPPLSIDYHLTPQGDAGLAGIVVVDPTLALALGTEQVVAFDPSTGQRVNWGDGHRASSPLTVPAVDAAEGDNGIVVFTEGQGPGTSQLAVADLASGDRLWTTSLGEVVTGSPAIADGLAIVGALDKRVYLVNLGTKQVRKMGVPGVIQGTPAVSGHTVFVTSEDTQTGASWLTAIDITNIDRPKIAWTYAAPQGELGTSSPTVSGDTVYAGFSDHVVRAFRGSSAPLWQEPIRGAFTQIATLAVADGDVFALDEQGGVYRLDGATGVKRWDFQFPEFVSLCSPLVVGSTVYVGLDGGTVAAVDVSTGHVRWKTTLSFGPMGAFAPDGDRLLASAGAKETGGIVAFRTDPSGQVVDEPSPTTLKLPLALANFAAAALGVGLVLLGMFRFVLRRGTRRRRPTEEPGDSADDGSTDETEP